MPADAAVSAVPLPGFVPGAGGVAVAEDERTAAAPVAGVGGRLRAAPGRPAGVDFTLAPGEPVRGLVLNPDGPPHPAMRVYLRALGSIPHADLGGRRETVSGGRDAVVQLKRHTFADGAGWFTFTAALGRYKLWCWGVTVGPFEVRAGDGPADVTIRLTK